MTFELRSERALVNLQFRYEHVFGFCKICGMLEHSVAGCSGPPDMSKVVMLGNPGSGVIGGGVEASSGKMVKNPNPSHCFELGLVEGLVSVRQVPPPRVEKMILLHHW